MNQKKSPGKKVLLGCGIAAGSVVLILILITVIGMFIPSDYSAIREHNRKKREKDSLKNIEKQDAITTQPQITKLSEQDYLTNFQTQWDSVKLEKKGKFPQYGDYYNKLSDIVISMNQVIKSDSANYLQLGKLKSKFIDSKKLTEAESNYLTYGQVQEEYELKLACEYYLQENLHDPGSLDILDYSIKGQTKKGWQVVMKYRAKNGFGAKVVETKTFDVRYFPGDNFFKAVSAN